MKLNTCAIIAKWVIIIINAIYMAMGMLSIYTGFAVCLNAKEEHSAKILGFTLMFGGLVTICVAMFGVYGAKQQKLSIMKIYTTLVLIGIVLKIASFVYLLNASPETAHVPKVTLIVGIIDIVLLVIVGVCSTYFTISIKRNQEPAYNQFHLG